MVKTIVLLVMLSGYKVDKVRREPLVYHYDPVPYYQSSSGGYPKIGWRTYWRPSQLQ